VGVNKFVSREKPSYQIHRADPSVGKEMARRIQNLREERDSKSLQRSLERIQQAARGKENIIPFIIDAVESYATVGDISNALIGVFGRWQAPPFK
jgi:methylmalonyl-CoA mutase N-terminal domain/subunit